MQKYHIIYIYMYIYVYEYKGEKRVAFMYK
jgi:hypothetical protein